MQSSYNFDKLFSPAKEEKSFTKDSFLKAALMFDFNTDQDFNECDREEIQSLTEASKQKMNGKYFLPDETRIKILHEVISLEKIPFLIEKFNVRSEYSDMMLRVIRDEKTDFFDLSDSELYYLLKMASLFPGKLDDEPIKYELRRRYHFVPFQQITKNFAGRNKELDFVNEYIDWLPKKGFINKTSAFFRNTINWHDKLPLVIQGIGGIGKSTLISKIILDNNNSKNGESLPFIYIDFDLPGFSLSEPMSVLLEGLRQLSYQYPQHREIFNQICDHISTMIYAKSQEQSKLVNFSSKSQRVFVYRSIEDIIENNSSGLSQINSPILIVFDSFEEIQYRASREELANFFSFIREISEKIPRIRPVFVGRSEISESLEDFKFENLPLNEFDSDSVMALLENYGINDPSLRIKIFKIFGGNPLLLLLASNLVLKDPEALNDGNQISEKKEEYLIGRILDHVHDSEVRQVAVPGMMVRRITPNVIQHVLAVPCGLGVINETKAKKIFDELAKEVALISKSVENKEIVFRQDLRLACENMIKTKHPQATTEINRLAIEYYKSRISEDEVYEAEYYFHLLKEGKNPELLTHDVYMRLRMKLESAVIELPSNSKLHVRSLIGSKVEQRIVDETADIEWAKYYIPQIKQGLNGNLDFIQNIEKEISRRKYGPEVVNSDFSLYLALLYQRLNKLSKSIEIVDRYFEVNETTSHFPNLAYRLRFVKAQNLEYQNKTQDAMRICTEIYMDEDFDADPFTLKKFGIMRQRLGARMKIGSMSGDRIMWGRELYPIDDFADLTWLNLINESKTSDFLNLENFDAAKLNVLSQHKDLFGLESLCRQLLGVYLKDVILAGEFEIVLQDLLYVLESRGLIHGPVR